MCSADVALLVHFVNELTKAKLQPSVENVQLLLLKCLMDDAVQAKQRSILFSFMAWIYNIEEKFANPDRFQHACVHAKYAFKCAAFQRMRAFKHAKEDDAFVTKFFRLVDTCLMLFCNHLWFVVVVSGLKKKRFFNIGHILFHTKTRVTQLLGSHIVYSRKWNT